MPDNENKKKIIKKIPRKPNRRSRPKVHDAFLKMFYRYPKVVSSLITKFIPKALIGEFDPNSLERQPDTFHNSKLSERREDLIWKVKTINGDVLYLYLLLEFQSQSLFLMPFRILEYTALFISSLYSHEILSKQEDYPPVLPIVLYTGKSKWTAPINSFDRCIKNLPDNLKEFQPKQSYYLIDVQRLLKESVEDEDNLSAPIFRVERCNTVNELLDEILKANLILKGELYDEIRLIFDDYFYAILTGIDNTIIETTDLTSG